MKLRPDQQRVKTLISDTITLLCKNGLIYDSEFCVEAVIGITLDKNQVFLVNINETVTKARKQQINLNGPVSKQRKRRASEEHSKKNGHSHEEGVSAHKTSKISVKDVLNAQLKTLGSIHHVKSNEQSRSPIVSLPESEERGEAFDLSFKNNPSALHVIRPDPAEENSHDHLVIEPTSKDEAEKIDKVDESIPASLDGNFEPIGTGPPVWPGLEPTLPFSSSSIDAESMADVTQSSTNENLNQSQEWAIIGGDAETGSASTLATSSSSPTSSAVASPQRQPIQLSSGKSACPECGKTFRENWMVRRHMLTHGEAAVECPLCNKRFKRKDTLKAHVDSKHPGHAYETLIPSTPQKSEPALTPTKTGSGKKKSNKKVRPAKQNPAQLPVWPGLEQEGPLVPMTIEEFEGTNGRVEVDLMTTLQGSSMSDPDAIEGADDQQTLEDSNVPSEVATNDEFTEDMSNKNNVIDGLELVEEDP